MPCRVLVLELNELTPALIERFITAGDLPNFARLRSESSKWLTDADEPQELLDPWIQWVTVHTGVSFDDHGVLKLGDGARNPFPTIADVLAEAGDRVWLCGSMNVVPRRLVGAHLPDPWAVDVSARPSELETFNAFVRSNVQEHTNEAARLSKRQAAAFSAFLVRHGLSRVTVRAVAGQLLGERGRGRGRWRRAVVLDRFQWDVFRWYWRRQQPRFATFFSNSTAHFQHMYWRFMDPTPFALDASTTDLAEYGDSIREGYRRMDEIVGEALALVDDNTFVVFCTALSQQPYLRMEGEGGKRFHRPYRLTDLLERLDVHGIESVAPVMAEQFHVYFVDDTAAESGERRLAAVLVDGSRAFAIRRQGREVFLGCALFGEVPAAASVRVEAVDVGPFHEFFYRSDVAKSGMHHPDGILWIRDPHRREPRDEGRMSLRSIAPTLLRLMDREPAPSMTAPAAVL